MFMTHIDMGNPSEFQKNATNLTTGAGMTYKEYIEALTKKDIGHGEKIKQDIRDALKNADGYSRPRDPYKEIREAQTRR